MDPHGNRPNRSWRFRAWRYSDLQRFL